MKRLAIACVGVIVLSAFSSRVGRAQDIPADLTIRAVAGSVDPWGEVSSIRIHSNGQVLYTRYQPGDLGTSPLAQDTSIIAPSAIGRIWESIEANNFFSLKADSSDGGEINARTFVRLSISADGESHEVRTQNVAFYEFDRIVNAINGELPADHRLEYDTSPPPFVFVRDACSGIPPQEYSKFQPAAFAVAKPSAATSLAGASAYFAHPQSNHIAHPASVVHYNMPLREAVDRGIAGLRSKGRFFGDGVAITVDNREPITTDRVGITLYIDFWGPTATQENVDRIEDAIEKVWSVNGYLTEDLRTVDVVANVVARVTQGGSMAPGTPGYHQIELVEDIRSNVVGRGTSFDVNRGAGSGTWATSPDSYGRDGVFAHEAGHLLGLPDRYEDFERTWLLGDKPWTREGDGARFSDEELAAIIQDREISYTYEEALAEVTEKEWRDIYSVPMDYRVASDLMATSRGFLDFDDLGDLIDQAGLLVYAQPGDVYLSKNPEQQSFVSTKLANVFAPAGEVRQLNGLYAACIDALKGVPPPGTPLDLAPPLNTWTGIRAAELLNSFLQSANERDEYCNDATLFGTWRMTDNVGMYNPTGYTYLEERGITLEAEEFLDFPRLSNPNKDDTTTNVVLPPELFSVAIDPIATLTQAGQPAMLNWTITPPKDVEVTEAAFLWSLTAPHGSSASLTDPANAAAVFTPDIRGFYTPSVDVSVSLEEWPDAEISARARVVVSDDETETFERSDLASDDFPWRTSSHAPWTISEADPHSGSFSARSGTIGDNDTTRLSIRMFLPTPGEVSFAYRVHAEHESDYLKFYIDGVERAVWSGDTGWHNASFSSGGGTHTFRWEYVKEFFGSFGADAAWIDDIFFPVAAVPTDTDRDSEMDGSLPTAFELLQNYPNPFNPVTAISYALPEPRDVRIDVFDVLGRVMVTLVDVPQPAGRHQVLFDATHLPSGIYHYRMVSGTFTMTRWMVVAK